MLQLRPVPSRLRLALALVLHGLALAAVIHSGAPFWLKLVLASLVPAALRREALIFLGHREAAELRLGEKSAELRLDGETIETGSPRVRHCSEWLVILEFPLRGAETGRRRFYLVLFPDSLPEGDLRKVRRWIHYENG